MPPLQIIGRRSSLFTRVTLIVAETLRVPYELIPIYEMTVLEADVYAGNPALKLPSLRRGDSVLFGTLNICRALAESAGAVDEIVWPEQLRDDLSRNAQELVWHCMSAQVQLIMGTLVGRLPADNVFFVKTRTGIDNALAWLDSNLTRTLEALSVRRALSIYEASLFCLIEHLSWRNTVSVVAFESLAKFAQDYGAMPAAQRTQYRFDTAPPT